MLRHLFFWITYMNSPSSKPGMATAIDKIQQGPKGTCLCSISCPRHGSIPVYRARLSRSLYIGAESRFLYIGAESIDCAAFCRLQILDIALSEIEMILSEGNVGI